MRVTVVGLGKIGLPLAVQFATKSSFVFGVDINRETVDLVNVGAEPFPGEANLASLLNEVVRAKKLVATSSFQESIPQSDVVVVVVPLFIGENGKPDFDSIDSATSEIAKYIKKGALVSFETTLPIGTTRKRFARMLEEISKMKVGKDFSVVFSPERVLTGRVFSDLRKYPKILGGVTENCAAAGVEFYREMLDFDERIDLTKKNGIWVLKNSEAAEFVKLAETTYRDVNIALANQFAVHAEAMDVDIYEVIEASNSQNYSHIHQPGVAVGGHCIPVYPKLYLETDSGAEIVRQARLVNEAMPNHLVNSMSKYFSSLKDLKVLILGLSYRQGVKETYASGAFSLRDEIKAREGLVFAYDPIFSMEEIEKLGFKPWDNSAIEIDCVVIQNHDLAYLDLFENYFSNAVPIFDGRNLVPLDNKNNVVYSLGSKKVDSGCTQ
jgi:nucleotide sugar dehydrogenase